MGSSCVLEFGGGAKRPLLVPSAISSHLRELGYPEISISSMNKCGEQTGWYCLKECDCSSNFVALTHHCNLRTCPRCSKIRKRRIFSRFLPFFKKYPITKQDFFQFLTISPPNYEDYEEGLKDIKKSFSKFLRRRYIKNRVKGGFYVLETKQNQQTGFWNIHIHAVLYGRWLDYRLRGKCLDCGQNLLKFNRYSKKFNCANRRCGSQNVIRFQDTKLHREWVSSSGSSAHIYGERVKSVHGAVSYLTKYISVDKTIFIDEKNMARYIVYTRKKKLINAFGSFFKDRSNMPKPKFYCKKCGGEVRFLFDVDMSLIIKDRVLDSHPPPSFHVA